jgi:Asp-tRNA(Asn)/Glu-tRNA(Gln) amidotransferase A subunit family amidase
MAKEDLPRLSATEAAGRMARRELSAESYIRALLERIDERDPAVRAFVCVGREGALNAARELDKNPSRGWLHGLAIGVKDIFDTAELPTQGGSDVYTGHQSVNDAACLALARHAGGIILGKTVTTELATFPPNETHHPFNLEHTPGGSSSGSVAAVADFMVPLATGTQTLGSTVRPAAYCGIIGYKPSFNLIPKKGVWPTSDTLDTVGVFARTVPDVALFVAAMLGFESLRLPEAGAGAAGPAPRVGLCRTFQWEKATPEMRQALEQAGQHLRLAGAQVRDVVLPDAFSGLLQAQTTVALWEMSRSLADEFLRHGQKLRKTLYDRCAEGYRVTGEDYQRAITLGRDCRQMLPDALGDCDVLLAPAATGEAPKGLDWTGDPVFNQVWTFLHTPCVAVPAGAGPAGLPLGLQVIGRIDDDRKTLAAADWVHRTLAARMR